MPKKPPSLPPSWLKALSKDDVNTFPLLRYEGPVFLGDTREGARAAFDMLAGEKVLGFDTETRPAFRKGESYLPSLLQLAGRGGVALFPLGKTGFTRKLKNLLSNPDIVKAGVAVDRDLAELNELSPFTPGGFVDLGHVARQAGLHHHGLRGLSTLILGERLSKGAQRTNWSHWPLTEKQIRYAAGDAWVGREIYLAFEKQGLV